MSLRGCHSPRDFSVPACECGDAEGSSQDQAATKPCGLAVLEPQPSPGDRQQRAVCHPAPLLRAQSSFPLKNPFDSVEGLMPVRGNDPGGLHISCSSSKVWHAEQVPPWCFQHRDPQHCWLASGRMVGDHWRPAVNPEQGWRVHVQPKTKTEEGLRCCCMLSSRCNRLPRGFHWGLRTSAITVPAQQFN